MPVEGSCQHSCGDNSSFDEVILFLKKDCYLCMRRRKGANRIGYT